MCGIVGYINFSSAKDTKAIAANKLDTLFNNLLIADSVRGLHSTGILGVEPSGEFRTYKKAINSIDFLELPITKLTMAPFNKFLIGHNRWATLGAVNDINAHPFTHGDITLFHNGTLVNWRRLSGKHNFSVDSEALCYHLSISQDKAKALEEVDGAYSLVWYDSSNSSLSFARNDERPMHIAYLDSHNQAIFASEKGMLYWIAERNKINIDSSFELESGKLVTFKRDNKPTYKKFTPKKYVPISYANYYDTDWDYSKRRIINGSVTSNTTVTTITKPNDDKVSIDLSKKEYIVVKPKSWTKYPNQIMANNDHDTYGSILVEARGEEIIVAGVTKAVFNKSMNKNIKIKVYQKGSKGITFGSFLETTDEKTEDESIISTVMKADDSKLYFKCSFCDLTFHNAVKRIHNNSEVCQDCKEFLESDSSFTNCL